MKERPIIFSTPMVQAIMAGEKTVTRRVLKDMHKYRLEEFVNGVWPFKYNNKGNLERVNCPYGSPGDSLWVRETWMPLIHRDRSGDYGYKADLSDNADKLKWKPSIHMPKAAARIWLEIVSVKVERLQDITRGDCMLEGCPFPNMQDGPSPRVWFAELWESINGIGSFQENPFVWVVEFKKVR